MEILSVDREIMEIINGTIDIIKRDRDRLRSTLEETQVFQTEYVYCSERLLDMLNEFKRRVGKELIDKEFEK